MSNDTTGRPSDPVGDGRGSNGRFAKGNTYSRGNPHAAKVQQIRAALFDAITPEAIKAAAEKLLAQAAEGDRHALAELLDRTIGKPVMSDVLERVEALERSVYEMSDDELMQLAVGARDRAEAADREAGRHP